MPILGPLKNIRFEFRFKISTLLYCTVLEVQGNERKLVSKPIDTVSQLKYSVQCTYGANNSEIMENGDCGQNKPAGKAILYLHTVAVAI